MTSNRNFDSVNRCVFEMKNNSTILILRITTVLYWYSEFQPNPIWSDGALDFLTNVAPTRTTRWVAIWDQFPKQNPKRAHVFALFREVVFDRVEEVGVVPLAAYFLGDQ